VASPSIPDRIHIEVLSRGKPLEGLLILTRMIMREKNDYFAIFGPTNDLGFLTIEKADLLSEAASTRGFYGIEFTDPLVSFAGLIEVRVLDEAGIERALEAYAELTQYPYREGHAARLREARRSLSRMGRLLIEVNVTAEGGTSEVRAEVPL
jgi:hypothetical protein